MCHGVDPWCHCSVNSYKSRILNIVKVIPISTKCHDSFYNSLLLTAFSNNSKLCLSKTKKLTQKFVVSVSQEKQESVEVCCKNVKTAISKNTKK